MATQLRAAAVWRQSGVVASGERDARGCWVSDQESSDARAIVESSGLKYVDDDYIARCGPGAWDPEVAPTQRSSLATVSFVLSVVVIMSLMYVLESQVFVGSMEVRERSMVMLMLMGRGQVPPLVALSG